MPSPFEPPMTDEDWTPNNLDEFEPGGAPEPFECGSDEYHEWMDEPYEPLIRCGIAITHGFIDLPGEPSTPVMDDVMEQAAEAMRGNDSKETP